MEVLVAGRDLDYLAAKEQDDILQWIIHQQQSDECNFPVVDMAEPYGERLFNAFQSMD